MTELAPVDERLRAWDERLRRVDENLLALEADATYQMLAGRTKPATLEGITQERVRPALEAMMRLFDQREKIVDVLGRAKEVRASISTYALWGTDEKLAEIAALLDGPSISMGQELTPLAERHLLDVGAREVAMRPEELLGAMVNAFGIARDAVTAVRNAWAKLEPALSEIEQDFAVLKRQAERAASSLSAELKDDVKAVERELVALRRAVISDPLGVEGTLSGAFRPRLDAVKKAIHDASGERERVELALAGAKALRRELDLERSAAQEAIVEIVRDFSPFVDAPRQHAVDDAALAELDAWVLKLDATVAAGHFHRAEIGIARYVETASGHRDAERAIVSARAALVAKRTELAGRLSARRAQLSALRARGAPVAAELEQRGREAESMLMSRPCALDDALPLVEAFEAEVVGLARR